MTRINVIDPERLSDAHLGAEYRELPRVFGLVRAAILRGESPDDRRNPSVYVLGTGHVRFFYPRLGFLAKRYQALCDECRNRGRVVNYGNVEELTSGISKEWMSDWEPDARAVELNIQRINDRGGLRKIA